MSATAAGLRRRLIVNADDLGQHAGINAGVRAAYEAGVLTSASLMVRWPQAPAAVAWGRDLPNLSLGLHLDLGEWAVRDGEWVARYQVVDTDDSAAVRAEIDSQVERFCELVGRPPTHLDSHQHVHRDEPVRSLLLKVAARLQVPVREQTGSVRYEGGFYGQGAEGEPWPEGISRRHLLALLAGLPDGLTELGCHPGDGSGEGDYVTERAQELAVLTDPVVVAFLRDRDIELTSF